MKQFFKQYKYHLLALATLLVIVGFSSHVYVKIFNFQFSIFNQFPITNFQSTTTSLNHNITTSPTTTSNLTYLPARQAIQQFNSTTLPRNNEQVATSNQLPITSYELRVTDYHSLSPTSTVYNLMQIASADSRQPFLFKTKNYPGMGLFVEEINGLKNDNQAGKYWIYYINGQSAKMGISQQIIKPNDVITWKYENSNM